MQVRRLARLWNVQSWLQADSSVVAVSVQSYKLTLCVGQLPRGLVGQSGVEVDLVDLHAGQGEKSGGECVHAWQPAVVGEVEENSTDRQSRPVSDDNCRNPMIVKDFEQLDEGVEGIMESWKPSGNDSQLRSSNCQAVLLFAECRADAHLQMSRASLAGTADAQAVPGSLQVLSVAAESVDNVMDGEVGWQLGGDDQLEAGRHLHLLLAWNLHQVTWCRPQPRKERIGHRRQGDLGSGCDLNLLLDIWNLLL